MRSADSSRSIVNISAAPHPGDTILDILLHQIACGSAEHADAMRMREQQKPCRMRESIDREHARVFPFCAQFLGRVGNRLQRGGERCVQLLVAFLAEAVRLHPAAKEIEAEIEIARI